MLTNLEGLKYLSKYLDYVQAHTPKKRFYISWFDSTTHWPFILPPEWKERREAKFYDTITNEPGEPGDTFVPVNVHTYLNTLRWTDDTMQALISDFRKRGLEDETLFIMYASFLPCTNFQSRRSLRRVSWGLADTRE
jgi:phosphoglycerol transferase MdoB-like AlkP superfamily enzyme